MTKAKKVKKLNAEQLKPNHRPQGGGVFVRDSKGIAEQLEGPGKDAFNQAKAQPKTGASS